MKTDVLLKALAIERPEDLIELTGDAGAEVRGAHSVEIPALQRRVDCVIELAAGGEAYYRHLEFQSEADTDMAERCFRYNTQLVLLYGAPVVTTVVYLFPPGPAELAFEVRLADRLVNRWQFDLIRLWELDAPAALERAGPGVLALVPLMAGRSLEVIGGAVGRIREAYPGVEEPGPLQVLLLLAGGFYTVEELSRIVPKETLMRSSIWEEAEAKGRVEGEARGRAEGKAEGRVEGKLEEGRSLCLDVLREYHPTLVPLAAPVVAACNDLERLRSWIVKAPVLDAPALARLIDVK